MNIKARLKRLECVPPPPQAGRCQCSLAVVACVEAADGPPPPESLRTACADCGLPFADDAVRIIEIVVNTHEEAEAVDRWELP
ncbi:MAG TPA: hypothetical protein VMS17_30680 [Gemmataceae bacterium]|nr:hypothetical protein [Gemmataceae bacterium]